AGHRKGEVLLDDNGPDHLRVGIAVVLVGPQSGKGKTHGLTRTDGGIKDPGVGRDAMSDIVLIGPGFRRSHFDGQTLGTVRKVFEGDARSATDGRRSLRPGWNRCWDWRSGCRWAHAAGVGKCGATARCKREQNSDDKQAGPDFSHMA